MLRISAPRSVACLAVALLFVLGQPHLSPVVSAQDADAQYAAQMRLGEQALARHQEEAYQAAVDAYKKANSFKKDGSPDALIGLSRAYVGLGAFKSAVNSCEQAIKCAVPDSVLAAKAHNERGLVLIAWAADHADAQKLKDAEVEFRYVIEHTDTIPVAGYNLGVVLLKQNRDAEGIHELQAYVNRGGRAPEIETAKAMIENPRRGREPFAPDFSVTTMDAEYLSSKDVKGKVVLLDFWGTWCPPCREATPSLVNLYKRHAGPSFVMIGIACHEKSQNEWRDFVTKNKMAWVEAYDTRDTMSRTFDVSSFPTYIVIDADGIIRSRQKGWSSASTINEIEDALGPALKAASKGKLLLAPPATFGPKTGLFLRPGAPTP